MKLISNYKDHDRLRCSFNNLAQKTFGISFEQWYQAGYWTDKYIIYLLTVKSPKQSKSALS
ncbi:hypothetical protein M1K46_18905 [Fictibacillus sp. WQ 8-8]|uniref:hypothetical protein n=1 Tax=Fictibacillus sp. WQ 8-8 TaxID=2938788 RepID=UPI00210E9BA4|nr:hypothetical protein [Fictibacillus sp. WQ 8-8]MCQ6267704.1 hypothetical protein [Fictibacillus sp. WQ 8-8]